MIKTLALLALVSCSWLMPATSLAEETAPRLRVLTQNLWGLPAPFSKNPELRLRRFCMALRNQNPAHRYDVVLLQEVWKQWMGELIASRCGYPHVIRLEEGNYETGLMILSDHPYSDARRKIFENKPSGLAAFFKGESISTKGILTAIIHHPAMGPIQVADLHVVANYGGDLAFEDIRRLQLEEAAEVLREQAAKLPPDLPVVMGGDLNVAPEGRSYTPLWDEIVRIFSGFERFIPLHAVSTRSSANPDSSEDEGQLDHLFSNGRLKPVSGFVTNNTPGMIFSDHYGWETTFILQ